MHDGFKSVFLIAAGVVLAGSAVIAKPFQLPVDCQLGSDCFIQSYPDMAQGRDVADPFCGKASYDDHKGLDIRLRSLADMERSVPVVAVAEGEVLRLRDGEPDRLATTDELRAGLAGKECGNGIVIAHPDGIEVQYCHLKQGSVAVKERERVKPGQKIGAVGSSGLSEVPHLHITVRSGGELIDAVTGQSLAEGCKPVAADPQRSLFPPELLPFMAGQSDLLGSGIADRQVDYDRLVVEGGPEPAKSGGPVTVGWAWFVNLRAGDRIRIQVRRPDGSVLIDTTQEPLPRSKAAYSAYAGRRQAPEAGDYVILTELIRNGAVVLSESRKVQVRE